MITRSIGSKTVVGLGFLGAMALALAMAAGAGPPEPAAPKPPEPIATKPPEPASAQPPAYVGRAVIRFADPANHPVDFSGQVLGADGRWVEVFRRDGYADPRSFRVDFTPVETPSFRLFIFKSSDARHPTTAQISEIELYPAPQPPEK
jgi:hypothetical protein